LTEATIKFATLTSAAGYELQSPCYIAYYSPLDVHLGTFAGFDSGSGNYMRSLVLINMELAEVHDTREFTALSN